MPLGPQSHRMEARCCPCLMLRAPQAGPWKSSGGTSQQVQVWKICATASVSQLCSWSQGWALGEVWRHWHGWHSVNNQLFTIIAQ